jgi:aerobic carbon-monoxide dehydrogenase medium subunit
MAKPATAGLIALRVRAALGVISRTQKRSVPSGTESSLSVMTLGLAQPESLIAANEHLADLAYIRLQDDELLIGSLTTRASVLSSPVISQYFPSLAEAAAADPAHGPGGLAAIGVSVCRTGSPDRMALALTEAGATVVIRSAHGERIVAVAELIRPGSALVRPGELVAEVRIPISPRTRYRSRSRTARRDRR